MKSVAGRLRLDLAQYRELEAFAAFGSDLDAASKAQLDRGSRLVELLKQPQYSPFPVEHEVVSIWAGTTGQLDDVPVEDIRRFESEFLDTCAASTRACSTPSPRPGALRRTVEALKQAIATSRRASRPRRASAARSRGSRGARRVERGRDQEKVHQARPADGAPAKQ